MQYAKVLGTDLYASKIVLGTDSFGSGVSKKESFALMDSFYEAGGNILDTASVYADWLTEEKSASEKTIGEWLKSRGCREKIVLSTKGGHPNLSSMDISRLSREELEFDLNNSLKNLKTGFIDIYWLHKDDENIPVEALIEIMNDFIASGKVRSIGVSNWRYERIKKANDYAEKHGLFPFISSQIQYSIATLNMSALPKLIWGMSPYDDEYKKYCADNINIFAFSSQSKGFFGMLSGDSAANMPENVKSEYLNESNIALAERLKTLACSKNVNISSLQTAALISDSNLNVFAQIGTKNPRRLNEILKYSDLKLSKDEIEWLLAGETNKY